METINLIANFFIFIGSMFFTIGVFGRQNSKMNHQHPFERFFVKLGLVGTCSASLYNLLSISNPPAGEILLNCSLGVLCSWAAWFHWKYFVLKK